MKMNKYIATSVVDGHAVTLSYTEAPDIKEAIRKFDHYPYQLQEGRVEEEDVFKYYNLNQDPKWNREKYADPDEVALDMIIEISETEVHIYPSFLTAEKSDPPIMVSDKNIIG